jgi:hypothetical protein
MSTGGLTVASLLLVAIPALFGLAASLTPNPAGFGTHQQLGLPPCSFLTLTGRVCPQCGLTTSFALLLKGRFSDALTANPAGPVLAALLALAWPWLLFSTKRKHWIASPNPAATILKITVAWLLLTFFQWLPRVF